MSVNTTIQTPKGLFQTDYPVGFIFPILKDKNGVLQYSPTPCHNTDEGQITACQIMDNEDFVEWAIDPWTSEINLEME